MEPNKMLDVKMSTFDRGFEYRTLNISADPRSQILFLRTKISNFVKVNSWKVTSKIGFYKKDPKN